MSTPGHGFRRLGERPVYDSRVVKLAVGRYAAPDGTEFEREVVHHPGAVAVVPLLDDLATVLLVSQYRSAIDDVLLEIPAGILDVEGESLEAAAARELEEEAGHRAGRLERLAELYNSAGFTDERIVVFLGLDLEPCATSFQGVEEQHMTMERVALADVPAMIADGRLRDGKTIIGLTLTREWLRARR